MATQTLGEPPQALGDTKHGVNTDSDTEDDLSQELPAAELVVTQIGTEEPGKNLRFPLYCGENTIGRQPSCKVVLDYDWISGRHASIDIVDIGTPGQHLFLLKDRGSRNHTFVVDEGSHERRQLKPKRSEKVGPGQVLVFGNIVCKIATLRTSPATQEEAAPSVQESTEESTSAAAVPATARAADSPGDAAAGQSSGSGSGSGSARSEPAGTEESAGGPEVRAECGAPMINADAAAPAPASASGAASGAAAAVDDDCTQAYDAPPADDECTQAYDGAADADATLAFAVPLARAAPAGAGSGAASAVDDDCTQAYDAPPADDE